MIIRKRISLRKGSQIKTEAASGNQGEYVFEAEVTSDHADYERESIIARTLKLEKNIPLVDTHDASTIDNILGKAIDSKLTDRGMRMRFRMVLATERIRAAAALIQAGIITDVSVGIIQPKFAIPSKTVYPQYLGIADRLIVGGTIIEVSLCAAGCNSEAIIVGRDARPDPHTQMVTLINDLGAPKRQAPASYSPPTARDAFALYLIAEGAEARRAQARREAERDTVLALQRRGIRHDATVRLVP